MELWGGLECTVNRVGDTFRDQTRLSGHQDRPGDLALIADLGVRSLRYPVLWERVAPLQPDQHDWRWSDARLAEIDRLGMKPIVGLLHHGSGPRYTSLVADDFVPLFADFARAAAERYPHATDWTPINEPLTTARFSTLYGHWYPHARNERSFWIALLNQIDGIRAAMTAIRRVVPDARLIQTEDLGEVHATPSLAGVAEHYNTRRWLTWDLLTGRVDRDHPAWEQAASLGLGDRLRAIVDAPCPPQIVGINHYPTSERFLDDRAERYDLPMPAVGYHDLTALRVLDPPPPGLAGMLGQTWDRYGLPLAVTESHLGCTREEQARWLWQAWRTCLDVRDAGVDVRALTVWALFGGTDWNSLITRDAGHYEPGVFDVRGDVPRTTVLADVARLLANGAPNYLPGDRLQPIVTGAGWWQRDIRLEHPPVAWHGSRPALPDTPAKPILIVGTGSLGNAFAGACKLRGLPHILIDRVDSRAPSGQVARLLDLYRPWAVIDSIDDGDETYATACAARGIHCTIFSSDPARETIGEGPLSATTLVVGTGTFFSPYDEDNLAVAIERALLAGGTFACSRHIIAPTYVPDLVHACLDLAVDGEGGDWHLTSDEGMSIDAFARRVATATGFDHMRIVATDDDGADRQVRNPPASPRTRLLPPLDDALARHAAVRLQQRRVPAEPTLCRA